MKTNLASLIFIIVIFSGVNSYSQSNAIDTAQKTPKNPVLFISFDNETPEMISSVAQIREKGIFGEIKYKKGLRSKGFLTGTGTLEYRLPTTIINNKFGSLTFWLRRLTWDEESYLPFITFLKRKIIKGISTKVPLVQIYRPKNKGIGVLRYQKTGNQFIEWAESMDWDDRGKWYFIAYTWDGNSGKFYIDGELIPSSKIASRSLSEVVIDGDVLLLQIGGHSVKYTSKGTVFTNSKSVIDEVKLYQTALSEKELNVLFSKNKKPGKQDEF